MKRTGTFIIMLILTFKVTSGQFMKVGGGLAYGTGFHFNNETAGIDKDLFRSPGFGMFVTGIYKLNLPFRIAPSFSYFIPRKNEPAQPSMAESTRISSMMFDINAHYTFFSPGRFEFYGLAGLDITFTGIKWSGTSSNVNDNAIGLNLGAGTDVKLTGKFDLFAEVKYIVGKYNQFILNTGVLFNLQPPDRNK